MFKVGDVVRVKAGISSNSYYRPVGEDGCSFDHEMDEYIGRKIKVNTKLNDRVACNGGWHYLFEWLEPWNDAEEWDGSRWVPKNPKTLANFGKMHGESDHKCKCHYCCNKPTYRPYKPGEVKCGDVFVRMDTGAELMVTGINPKGLVSLNGWNDRSGWKTPDELLAEYTKPDGSPAGILDLGAGFTGYTFAEAYARMKEGKWMKPATKAKYVECYKIMPNGNVCYLKHDGCTGYYNPDAAAFSAEIVADQWQEAMQLK